MKTELEPIDPSTAVEMYLAERKGDVSEMTLASHKSRLSLFIGWCEDEGIENLNDLTGRALHQYRIWRKNDGNLAPASLKTQIATLRVFIRWCENIDAVETDLHTKVLLPTLSADESSRDVMLDSDTAEQVLTYLEKYEYASLRHVTVALLWHTMMRRGAARALDVEDYDPTDQLLEVHHRPETDTPIKNGAEGERMVALSPSMCELLDDWLTDQRPEVTDEYGRKPLLATLHGRAHYTTIQSLVYAATRPCLYAGECPHDRDESTCEAIRNQNKAYACPSSVSPHPIRRGAITHWLQRDVPERVVSDRANVSQTILDRHYDRRTEREKMEQRRGFLDNV